MLNVQNFLKVKCLLSSGLCPLRYPEESCVTKMMYRIQLPKATVTWTHGNIPAEAINAFE